MIRTALTCILFAALLIGAVGLAAIILDDVFHYPSQCQEIGR
jgi:hypothetical protein